MPLLEVRGLTRSFYGVHALTGLDLDVDAGTITGLGPVRHSLLRTNPTAAPNASISAIARGTTVRAKATFGRANA